MSALAAIRDRVEQLLLDVANAIYTTGVIDEGIRLALDEYNFVNPLQMETNLTLEATGREISLSMLTNLLRVQEVWWPWETASEYWPPNRVRGFRVYWDDAAPYLFLDIVEGDQPQAGDVVRIWYAARHAIKDLDSAAATTLPLEHESRLVIGAAGHAAMSRALDLVEVAGTDLYQVGLLGSWGVRKLKEYTNWLKELQRTQARSGPAWGTGWALDKWDEGRDLPKTTYG
jgi:hypothetical protein